MKKKVIRILNRYLLYKDILNVSIWIAITWFSMAALSIMFGNVNAPALSMSYVIKGFMGISVFGIFLTGAWITLRVFFPEVANYFTDPDGEGDQKPQFSHDLKHIQEKCSPRFRVLFFLSFYLALVTVLVLSATTLF